jgi:hypothetical protein
VGHASRSSSLLGVEASLAKISQSDLKTGGGCVGGKLKTDGSMRRVVHVAPSRVVHVAPSRRLRRRQVEDGRVDATGCVGPCYPTFAVFNVLGPRGIVVI